MKTYILIIFITFIACSTNYKSTEINGEDMITIEINPRTTKKNIYDSIFSDIKFVGLKSTGQDMLGEITQLLFSDSLIFAVDTRITKAVNIYDYKGNLKKRICNIGRGPKEYVNLTSVTMDEDNKLLVLRDGFTKRLLYYKFNGEFSHSEKFPLSFSEMEFLGKERFLNTYGIVNAIVGPDKYNSLLVTDDKSNLEYGFYKSCYSKDFHFTKNGILKKYDGKIYFTPNICDTIFVLSKNEIKAKYHIKIEDGYNVACQKYKTEKEFWELVREKLLFNGDFIEFDNLIYFRVLSPEGYKQCIYYKDKKDEVTECCHIDNHPLHRFIYKSIAERFNNNTIVYRIQAHHLMQLKQHLFEYYPQYNDYLSELYKDLTEDSDPVIIFGQVR